MAEESKGKKMYRAPKMRPLATEEKKSKIESKWDPRPELTFTEEELPAIKTWKMGKEYDLHLKVKLKSMHLDKDGKETSGRFTVVSVGAKK